MTSMSMLLMAWVGAETEVYQLWLWALFSGLWSQLERGGCSSNLISSKPNLNFCDKDEDSGGGIAYSSRLMEEFLFFEWNYDSLFAHSLFMMHREAQIYNSIWLRKVGSVECVKNEVSMRQPALFVLLIRLPSSIQPYRQYLNWVLYASHQPHKLITLIIWYW